MATYRENPIDIEPPDWNDYEQHDASCECDACAEAFDHEDEIPAPSQAELERMRLYFLAQDRSA